MKVLVVDDVSVMRFVLVEILIRDCGIEREHAHEAENGKDAIEKYKSHNYDIVFLDITMPDIDGISVVKKIVNINHNANIIMYTSSGEEEDIMNCIDAGARDCILKPPHPDKVADAIERITGRKIHRRN